MTARWRDPAVPDVWHTVSPLHGETLCFIPLPADASIVIAPPEWRPAVGSACAQCQRPIGKRPAGAPKPRIARIWYGAIGRDDVRRIHRLSADCYAPVCDARIGLALPTVGGIGAPPLPLGSDKPSPACPVCFPRPGDVAGSLAAAHRRARAGRR